MAGTRKRQFGVIREKPNKTNPTCLEASYPTPVWAFAKWPDQLPAYQYKRFEPDERIAAEAWLAQARKEIKQHTWQPRHVTAMKKKAATVTFTQYATDYIEHRLTRSGEPIEETTKAKYYQYLRDHLAPVLGNMPMTSITARDINNWVLSMKVGPNGEGATIRRRCWELLRAIFNHATTVPVDASGATLLANNPAKYVEIRRPDSKREFVEISSEELDLLYSHMNPRYALLIYLVGVLGLRPSEALALHREDCELNEDHSGGFITVAHSLKRIERTGRYERGKTKTAGSVRTLGLPKFVAQAVAAHLARFTGPAPNAPLFTAVRANTYISLSTVRNYYCQALESVPRLAAMKKRPPLYNLRHNAITHAGTYTLNEKAIMGWGGHTQLATSAHYRHPLKEDAQKIIDGFQREHERHTSPYRKEPQPVQPVSLDMNDETSALAAWLPNQSETLQVATLRALDITKRLAVLSALNDEAMKMALVGKVF